MLYLKRSYSVQISRSGRFNHIAPNAPYFVVYIYVLIGKARAPQVWSLLQGLELRGKIREDVFKSTRSEYPYVFIIFKTS